MITAIKNNLGIINYNNHLLSQIISDSLRPYEDRLWLQKKSLEIGESGIMLTLELNIKFGESMSSVAKAVIHSVSEDVIHTLELPIDNIVIIYVGTVSKNTVPRDIRFDYKEWYSNLQ